MTIFRQFVVKTNFTFLFLRILCNNWANKWERIEEVINTIQRGLAHNLEDYDQQSEWVSIYIKLHSVWLFVRVHFLKNHLVKISGQ